MKLVVVEVHTLMYTKFVYSYALFGSRLSQFEEDMIMQTLRTLKLHFAWMVRFNSRLLHEMSDNIRRFFQDFSTRFALHERSLGR